MIFLSDFFNSLSFSDEQYASISKDENPYYLNFDESAVIVCLAKIENNGAVKPPVLSNVALFCHDKPYPGVFLEIIL